MKISSCLYLLLISVIVSGCDFKKKNAASTLSFTLKPEIKEIDTVAILSEIKGLTFLTDSLNRYGKKPEVKITSKDSLLVFRITPKLSAQNQKQMEHLLDRLMANPTPFSATFPQEAFVNINETSKSLLELLHLKTGDRFPLKPLPGTAIWEYDYREENRMGGLIDVYVTPYLVLDLEKTIPSLDYKLALENPNKSSQNKTQELISSMFDKMNPGAIDFSIQTGNSISDSLWTKFKSNNSVSFEGKKMVVRLSDIDFEMIFPTSLTDDKVANKSIAKLMEIHPLIYHLVLAPELSRTVKKYQFD